MVLLIMMTKQELEKLVRKATKRSQKTRVSPYYGAPAWDLTEKEIEKHYGARELCCSAWQALNEAGDPRAHEFYAAMQLHSDVVNRRGCSF